MKIDIGAATAKLFAALDCNFSRAEAVNSTIISSVIKKFADAYKKDGENPDDTSYVQSSARLLAWRLNSLIKKINSNMMTSNYENQRELIAARESFNQDIADIGNGAFLRGLVNMRMALKDGMRSRAESRFNDDSNAILKQSNSVIACSYIVETISLNPEPSPEECWDLSRAVSKLLSSGHLLLDKNTLQFESNNDLTKFDPTRHAQIASRSVPLHTSLYDGDLCERAAKALNDYLRHPSSDSLPSGHREQLYSNLANECRSLGKDWDQFLKNEDPLLFRRYHLFCMGDIAGKFIKGEINRFSQWIGSKEHDDVHGVPCAFEVYASLPLKRTSKEVVD